MTLTYREFEPAPPLSPYVERYWCVTASRPLPYAVPNRIMPDGCVDILFNAGDAFRRDAAEEPGLRSLLVGPMWRPVVAGMRGVVEVVGVRFRPEGAYSLLGLPLSELDNRLVPMEDLTATLGAKLDALLQQAADPIERVRAIERVLRRRLGSRRPADETVSRAVTAILHSRGRASIDDIARAAGTSGRNLERRFTPRIGLTPKMFSRVIRFRRVMTSIRNGRPTSWSRLAADAGYYDQSHLIREFKAFSGLTPEGVLREHARVGIIQYESPAQRIDCRDIAHETTATTSGPPLVHGRGRGVRRAGVGTVNTSPGGTVHQAEHDRRIDYVEFAVTSVSDAKRFYSSVFGWTFEDWGPEYASFDDGRLAGGFRQAAEPAIPGQGALVIIYAVDLEAVRAKVEEAGGTIVREPFAFPGGRRFHFTDPSGNELAVWTDR